MRSPGRPRPVGRGPKVRAAVLAAALAELAASSYAGLTIENIARRAGVHKTTIYRRWKTRERIVADLLGERVAVDIPIPDTGSARSDLQAMARAFVDWVTSPTGRTIFAAVYSEAASVPGIAEARRDLFEYGPRRAAIVIERAVERGELPTGTSPSEAIKALIAPLYFRLEVTGDRVDEGAADQAASIVHAAARAGVFVQALPPSPDAGPPGAPPSDR
ncbi:MAG: TetR/AcrR family transcriptional regulator C-terminal ligand-binding domain-containing protein [Candidatus Dormibacteraeota bacterium]|nr:TetR/AcrR family transcriptional regulator C-terminal ligand-binding domain-containing protein [Candidatus Dormibacteraeota bacterium]MBO0762742.1 TetR/AcrR family transcriptional regulator C-terminal ligand-binding domain-containing protein [Candidatus Dormibacteraeota bacterium]